MQACPAHFPFPSPVNRNPLPWGEPTPQHGIQDSATRQLPLSPFPCCPPTSHLAPAVPQTHDAPSRHHNLTETVAQPEMPSRHLPCIALHPHHRALCVAYPSPIRPSLTLVLVSSPSLEPMGSREADPILPRVGPADLSHPTQGTAILACWFRSGSLKLPQSNFNPRLENNLPVSHETRTKTRRAPSGADSHLWTVE